MPTSEDLAASRALMERHLLNRHALSALRASQDEMGDMYAATAVQAVQTDPCPMSSDDEMYAGDEYEDAALDQLDERILALESRVRGQVGVLAERELGQGHLPAELGQREVLHDSQAVRPATARRVALSAFEPSPQGARMRRWPEVEGAGLAEDQAQMAPRALRRDRSPLPAVPLRNLDPPQPCSFLQPGQTFTGSQRVSRSQTSLQEDWTVVVTVQECNLETGYICGSMLAENVPRAKAPVITFWEGDIIDNMNSSFITSKWSVQHSVDLQHWRKFEPFRPLEQQVKATGGRSDRLGQHSHIFMRWKERWFQSPRDPECGLTIAGFYYLCLCRQDGSIQGFYHDPSSNPYQRLSLKAGSSGASGHASAHYEFMP